VTDPPWSTVTEPTTTVMDGSSLTGFTVKDTRLVTLRAGPSAVVSSVRTTSTLALPLALAAGVQVRSPLVASTAGPAAKSPGWLLAPTPNVRVWVTVPSPSLMPEAQAKMVCGPASSSTAGTAPAVKRGASLTILDADGERVGHGKRRGAVVGGHHAEGVAGLRLEVRGAVEAKARCR
jgi:hypothetical protein